MGDNSDSEPKHCEKSTLKTADLTRILSSIQKLRDEIYELDGDCNRSANVKRSITAAVRSYAIILQERRNNNQSK